MKRFALAIPPLILTLLLTAATPVAPSQEGRIIQRLPVRLEPAQVDELKERVPTIGGTLERVRIERITYLSDGLKVNGYLVSPLQGDHLPCVIFNRGGNRDFGALTDLSVARLLAPIAEWGYVVVASQYRGNAGSEGAEEFGGADVRDTLNLIPLLESLPQADGGRIGMFGWSRGGMMTYLALAQTDRLRAAVIGAGVADAFASVQRRPEMEKAVFAELVPRFEQEREAALHSRSAIRWPEKLAKNTPLLLLHGTADWRVHPSQALRMSTALLEAKHPFRLVLFEGGDHGLSEHREEVQRLLKFWLDTYVRDGRKWPSLEPHGR